MSNAHNIDFEGLAYQGQVKIISHALGMYGIFIALSSQVAHALMLQCNKCHTSLVPKAKMYKYRERDEGMFRQQ